MLGKVGQLAVKLADLAEAEGRVARVQFDRILHRTLLVLMAAAILLGGLGVLAWGVFLLVADWLGGPARAGVVVGVLLIVLAAFIYFSSSQFIDRQAPKSARRSEPEPEGVVVKPRS